MRRPLLLVVLGSACGPTPSACPNDLPPACPTTPPSYHSEVAPVLQERCVPCHRVGGAAADRPLDAYASVYTQRSTVLTQVYGCVMPPPDAGAMSSDERAVVLGWLVCHAPDN